jgi:hypothetical protein
MTNIKVTNMIILMGTFFETVNTVCYVNFEVTGKEILMITPDTEPQAPIEQQRPSAREQRRLEISDVLKYELGTTVRGPGSISGHVGFVVDKATLGQVSSYFGFPCQFSFHQMLHTHLPSGAGYIQ